MGDIQATKMNAIFTRPIENECKIQCLLLIWLDKGILGTLLYGQACHFLFSDQRLTGGSQTLFKWQRFSWYFCFLHLQFKVLPKFCHFVIFVFSFCEQNVGGYEIKWLFLRRESFIAQISGYEIEWLFLRWESFLAPNKRIWNQGPLRLEIRVRQGKLKSAHPGR